MTADSGSTSSSSPDPRYVFAVTFRLEPAGAVSIEPATFETTLYRPADPPPTSGWRFFRDNLWRGSLADPAHFRSLTADTLGVPVTEVTFRRFEVDPASFEALREAVGEHLEEFRATTVDEVINKYFGSSIEVTGGESEG